MHLEDCDNQHRIFSNVTYINMQEEMVSDEHKGSLKEMVDLVINDGHISLLENALNNATKQSQSSSTTSTTAKVVRFLMDGGANTCLPNL